VSVSVSVSVPVSKDKSSAPPVSAPSPSGVLAPYLNIRAIDSAARSSSGRFKR